MTLGHPQRPALETLLDGALLLVVAVALGSTVQMVHLSRRGAAELELARSALESVRQEVMASAAEAGDGPRWSRAVVAAWHSDGPGSSERGVDGLVPWKGERGVCSVEVITDETMTDQELGVHLGLPRDLDADGEVTSVDVRGRALLLPVLLRARWHGAGGERELVRALYLEGY